MHGRGFLLINSKEIGNMKRLAIVAAVLVLAACTAQREEAAVDTLPDMAPAPAPVTPDTLPTDTVPRDTTP
jgi:uncharacterized lipoprotein YajG